LDESGEKREMTERDMTDRNIPVIGMIDWREKLSPLRLPVSAALVPWL
jgi:hypothetical protein